MSTILIGANVTHQESIQPELCKLIIEGTPAILQKQLQGNCSLVLFYQKVFSGPNLQRSREGDRRISCHKIPLKGDQIIRFFPQVELFVHHASEHLNLFSKRNPLHPGKERNKASKKGHDREITLYKLDHTRV